MYFLERLKEAQQFQLTNIFLQYIKNYLYIIIYSRIALGLIDTTIEQNNCSVGGRYYLIIVENGSICFVIFNLIALIYILRQQDFARLEFFIMYGLNLGWFFVILIYSLITLISREYECSSVIIFRKAFLFVCIKKEIEIGALLYKQSEGFLRQVNICANTVFAFLLIFSPDQQSCSSQASMIVMSITIENVVSLIFFTIVNVSISCFSLHNQGFKAVKFVSIIILCSFTISYIVIMYFNATDNIPFSPYCVPIIFVMESYTYVIPISLASMAILYYSLILQYKLEQQQEEGNNSKQKNGFSSSTGFALSANNASYVIHNNQDTQQNEQEGRKTVSNHRELIQLYKSGQLKNKDDAIDDLSDFQPSRNTYKSNNNLVQSNQMDRQGIGFQSSEQPINFYEFQQKINQKQNETEQQGDGQIKKQMTFFNQNNNNNMNQFYQNDGYQDNNIRQQNSHANQLQQHNIYAQSQSNRTFGQESIQQMTANSPTFNMSKQNNHSQF